MIPGIGTIVNGVGVLVVGILSRVIFKKELKDFEDNLLPLGLLVLATNLTKSPSVSLARALLEINY